MRSKVTRLKNTIYRVHRSDLWGFVIQKWKNDRITRFLLRNFEYLFVKSFLGVFRNAHHSRYFSDWIRREGFVSQNLIHKLKKENLKVIAGYPRFSTKSESLNYWKKFKMSSINDYLKPTFDIGIIQTALFMSKKSSSRNYLFTFIKADEFEIKAKHFSRASINQFGKRNTISKWLQYDPTFIRLQKIKPFHSYMPHWWRFRMLERKMTYFYSFSNVKKFRQMQIASFYTNKIRVDSVLRSEGLLCILLFRLNLFTSMYFIDNFIKSGNILINGRPVYNKHYTVKLFDDISIKKDSFVKIFNSFWLRLKSKKLLINAPDYIISNYKIMAFSIWRYPTRSEVIAPYDFPFNNTAYDLSIGRRKPPFSLGP